MAHCFPFDELGHNEAPPLDFADFIDSDDVRMVERRGRARFLLEAPHTFGVARELGGQQLDRNLAAQSSIVREPDFAHPAATQWRQDSISAYLRRRVCRRRR